jgi:hypothetical protein
MLAPRRTVAANTLMLAEIELVCIGEVVLLP